MNKNLFEYSQINTTEVLNELDSSLKGLSEREADLRIKKYGHNLLEKKKELFFIFEFLLHFKSPLILILIFATLISAYLGRTLDATIIAAIILISVILDFVEEKSADRSVQKLIESVKITSKVIRDGKEREIATKDLCVGDIIFLHSGDMIPADCRIIDCKDFFVNQAALTGESFPLEKISSSLEKSVIKKESLTELQNIIFSGTNVVSGTAIAIVLKTAKDTELGKIAHTLIKKPEKSEFEIGVTHFGYFVIRIMLFIVLFIFLFNSLTSKNILQAFLFAVAIAVGITPELLSVILSVNMAKGSLKMAKKGVIVKKLIAIPNFGSMDILCTDKTGTLTKDQIKVVKYINLDNKESDKVLIYSYLNSYYETGIKNPLDKAILEFSKDKKLKIDVHQYAKVDEVPFDFYRKRMSIVVKTSKEKSITEHILITKGAPEEIFKCCLTYNSDGDKGIVSTFDKKAQEKALKQYHQLSAQGYKVLALASKKYPAKENKKYEKEDENALTLEGFIAFFDEPRKEMKDVIKHIVDMGVEIKILTGDNEIVTKKVCSEIGLDVKGILLGSELHKLNEEALMHKAEKTTIFARFSPEQKNRIIKALKAKNHVVGYMGDGINDAPSLKDADVGISVNNAVDIAKETAELVLTHKSLEVLRDGIIEGRKVFGNTIKYIMMGISSNFGNMFSAAGAILFLPFLPMLPIQILLNNLIYDFSQITIPSDNVDKEWINKPKRWNIKFIKHFMYVFGPISSFFDFLTFGLLFFVFKLSESAFQTGWFIESLATQVLVIHVIRTKKIAFLQSRPSLLLFLSTIFCISLGWIIPHTVIGKYFSLTPLPWYIMLCLGVIVLTYLITIEMVKRIFYKKIDF